MNFSFGIDADSAVRSSKRPLSPWNIHDVKFKGVEVKEFDGKKDPSQHYKTLNINFENADGDYFSLQRFFPKDGDDERRKIDTKDGGTRFMPSNFENLMAIIKQTLAVLLEPKKYEAFRAASAKFTSFEAVCEAMKKVTASVVNKPIKIKLVGRNRDGKVVPEIPNIVAINHEGELFVCDNYIGDKLFFSDYEEGKRKEYLNAKPTEMKSEIGDPVKDLSGSKEEAADDDLDALLGSL
jgi:hypothetical protein